jgi:hypothetical protein
MDKWYCKERHGSVSGPDTVDYGRDDRSRAENKSRWDESI